VLTPEIGEENVRSHTRRPIGRQASRRCQERRDAPSLQEFSAAPTGSAFSASIVTPADLADIAARTLDGDVESGAVLQAILQWLSIVPNATAGQGPICLDCDLEFRTAVQPVAIGVVVPFTDPSKALVTGICAICAAHAEDLLAMLTRRARDLWPDAQTVDCGHG
jgi:hypothetical protein